MFSLYMFLVFSILNVRFAQENINEFIQQQNLGSSENSDPKKKNYEKITMAYITPWNKEGIPLALKYASKIDILSPAWFNFKPETIQNKFSISIEGSENVNEELMDEIKEKNPKIKIVPRFHCENFSSEALESLTDDKNFDNIMKLFIRRLKYNGFNGIAFECHSLIHNLNKLNRNFLVKFHETMRKNKFLLINTIFAYNEFTIKMEFDKQFNFVAENSDYVNIMTYDYFNHFRDGKIAPISWIRKTLEFYSKEGKGNLQKILLGIPFHGAKITDNKELDVLTSHSLNKIFNENNENTLSLIWDQNELEHKINYNENSRECNLFFPSKKFIKSRLEFSKEKSLAGVSVWDIAQGFEGFMEEF